MSNPWFAAAAGVAELYLKKNKDPMTTMKVLKEQTFRFFDENFLIREKVIDHAFRIQVVSQTVAHYVEGLGILCIDLEARILISKTGAKSFLGILQDQHLASTIDLPPGMKEQRGLVDEPNHTAAVRRAVTLADDFCKVVDKWCSENFDKIEVRPQEAQP